MKIPRRFSALYQNLAFESREVVIQENSTRKTITVPRSWSNTAAEIFASKYLWRGDGKHPGETDSRQAFDRLAGAWKHWGERLGLFSSAEDARNYYEEMRAMLACQMGSPNSPQWFNTGIHHAYQVTGPAQGHFYVDLESRAVRACENSWEHPQAHACFIQSVKDDLVNPGGIMDLWVREARLFKFGSGSGTNFSSLRGQGEPLAGGGGSSGLMSFLRVGDAAAGAVRSGGTTRRAAKMVCVDVDHPDIEAFVQWKAQEEKKVSALLAGNLIQNKALKDAQASDWLPPITVKQIHALKAQGESVEFASWDSDWRNEAYQTISGQNSNNTVRVSDDFLKAIRGGKSWSLKRRTDGQTAREIDGKSLWHSIARAAWECADPGLQFSTTIDKWHTCPVSGSIRASNPCSEYLFLDDTGCNLASLNLLKFLDWKTGNFDTEGFEHAVRLWTITLEITVAMAGYPSEAIARQSAQFRTLGLGYANLGGLFMALGIAYSSAEAQAWASALTSLMTAQAYATSAEMAAELGPFSEFSKNRDAMLEVLRNHSLALSDKGTEVAQAAKRAWEKALISGNKHGFRNAQVTAVAPTGTIGLMMDCDTLGIEPEFSLVKHKTLAGGGFLTIPNRILPLALERLGYSSKEKEAIAAYGLKKGTLEGAPHLKQEHVPVFDCAVAPVSGGRVISPEGHLQMVAAAQPFVSGGISKTIGLPEQTTVKQVEQVHERAWELGLKAVSIYRAGSKLSEPLGSVGDLSCRECT